MSSALNTILPTTHRLKRLPNAALAFALTAIFLVVQFCCYYVFGRIPWHDSKVPLDGFHAFYTLWQQTGTYPAWIDYGVYGYPIYFIQNAFLTHSHFLVACIGLIFGIRDTLALYYVAVLLNHLIFLTGLFLLGTALFRHWASIALLVIVGGLSSSWLVQSSLNFSSQHTLPLILYFLVVGLHYRSLFHLILAGVVAIAMASATSYTISIPILSCTLLLTSLLFMGEPSIRSLLRCCARDALKFRCVVGFVAFVSLTALMAAYIKLVIDNTALLRSSGAIDRIVIPLKEFLQGPNRLPLVEFLTGETVHADTTFYFGLIPFALFIVGIPLALRRRRSIKHKAFLILVLCMIGLTAGGVTATLFYFVPPMPFYRNIGHVYSFVRLFMIIGAAFGLDQTLIWMRRRRLAERLPQQIAHFAHRIWTRCTSVPLRYRIGIVIVILLCADIAIQNAQTQSPNERVWVRSLLIAVTIMGSVVLAMRLLAMRLTGRISAKSYMTMLLWLFLVGTVVSDLTLYQFAVFKRAITDNSWVIHYYHSRPWPYVAERVRVWRGRTADDFREWQARRKLIANNVNYEQIYLVFGVDPCLPHIASDVYERSQFSTISVSRPVVELIKLRGGAFTRETSELPEGDRWLARALACGSQKFWIAQNVHVFATLPEMQQRLADASFPPDSNQALVVAAPAVSEHPTISDAANVFVESYVPQRIRLRVEGLKTNAWLVTSIPYHSGWTARVDGVSRSIAPANGAFFALPVKSSDHLVELEFHDIYGDVLSKIYVIEQVCVGMAVISIGLAVVLIGLGGYRPKSRNAA